MEIFALFMFLGIFTSFCIPETKRKTLEELSEELHGEIDYATLAHRKRLAEQESSGEFEENSDKVSNSV